MEQTLVHLGTLCNHAHDKLVAGSSDLDALADVATVVLLVSALTRRWTPSAASPSSERRLEASRMALTSIDRKLSWLSDGGALEPADTIRHVVDRALHLTAEVLRVLQGVGSAQPGASGA
jgi:hypothetical protein